MTPRQARTERRAAERKAKKLERKKALLSATAARLDEPATFSEAKIQENDSAERKAKKLESKKAKLNAAAAPEHSSPTSAGFVSHDRALAKIFPPEMVAEAIAFREKVLADLDTKPDTSKRAEINRANSQHSTGPRSPQGKLASSRNSLKHGLASGQMIIPGEDTAAFEALLGALLEEHQPANPTEELLINDLAQSHWLTQRAIRFQNECFTESGVDEKRLALFLRYQTTHERSFHKALNTLMKLKKDRTRGFVSHSAAKPGKHPGFVSQEPLKQSPEHSDGPPNPASIRQNADSNQQITELDQKAEAA